MTTSIVLRRLRDLAHLGRHLVAAPFLALAALVLLGCAGIDPQPPPEALQLTTYTIGPPDRLDITVLPEPQIQRQVTVRPDGRISFDLIGDVDVAGRTPGEIAREIEERIAYYKRDPRVTVDVAASFTDSITIFGEVRAPGAFPLERDTRLAEAIGLRGGPTSFARKGRVRVIRVVDSQTEVFIADIGAIQRGDLTTNIFLRKGDIVVVPPNILARIGYTIQMVVFPFTTIIGPALTGASAAGTF
jgi:polysaccharide export outer membrane protein